MQPIKKRHSSYFTATDEFCGAGGTTTGAKWAGLEVKMAMAFPGDYVVLGTKREQVKQLGNAVTPPASKDLCERCIESLL